MRTAICTHVLLFAIVLAQCVSHTLAVWPRPASMKTGNGGRTLASAFRIDCEGCDQELQQAVGRASGRARSLAVDQFIPDHGAQDAKEAQKGEELTVLEVKMSNRATSSSVDKHKSNKRRSLQDEIEHGRRAMRDLLEAGEAGLLVEKRSNTSTTGAGSISKETFMPVGQHNEAYRLTIGESGSAVLEASSALGILRGLSTFVQLVFKSPDGSFNYVAKTPIMIEDKPAFPYRGIMLDTARNFIDMETLRAQLDAMELFKINQFHWHATDTASWPLGLETKDLGRLAKFGSYGPDKVYSPDDMRALVAYAAQRGINVIVEIDMPGHQYMGVADYPGELITCANKKDWTNWGAEPPTGHLDIRKSGAAKLMKDVLSELANYLPGPYMSTGNDEVEPQCYGLNKTDKTGMDKLLAPFVGSMHKHIKSLDKTPIVWEEALLDYPQTGKNLAKGTIVEAWTTSSNVAKILQGNPGVNLIHAPSDYFYLDCGMGDFLGNYTNGQSWCPFVSWQKMYSFNPYNGTQGITNGKERVLGGESALWTEQVDDADIESTLWPRAAAGAEVFWTGAQYMSNGKQMKRAVTEALPRLHTARARLRKLDIYPSALQPMWCAYRPGQCDMYYGSS